MNYFTLALWLMLPCAGIIRAETLESRYANLGRLIVTNFASAPFPHPDRARGHQYHTEFFSLEKSYSDSSVAIFIPRGFQAALKTDFILHFHGWRNHIDTVLSQFHLIEQFCESRRNAILIIPQGPRDAADSFGGKLEDRQGFENFMAETVRKLIERGILQSTNIGNIILSGHSGGYHVMAGIVTRGGLRDHIREVWLFDALYGQTEQFIAWFATPAAERMVNIYTLHGGTREETENLMAGLRKSPAKSPFLAKKESQMTEDDLKNSHLLFIDSALEHNQVIFKREQFRDYLKTSIFKPLDHIRSPKDRGN